MVGIGKGAFQGTLDIFNSTLNFDISKKFVQLFIMTK